MRLCSKCGEAKDRFPAKGHWCTDCTNGYQRDWRKRNPDRVREAWKRSQEKTGYAKRWSREHGTAKSRRYVASHRQARNAYQRMRYRERYANDSDFRAKEQARHRKKGGAHENHCGAC